MKKMFVTLIVLMLVHICTAQHTINGKVLLDKDLPAESVTVEVKKQLIKTKTDENGNFTLQSSEQYPKISFSLAEYLPVTIKINNPDSVMIVMHKREIILDEVRINAFETNSDIRNAALSAGILNKNALNRYSNINFLPAINSIPGVKMEERSPGSYRLNIRGNLLRSTFGVRNVKMYWNGLPYTDANGNTYLNQLSFSNIGRMEIIKGPSGSMYGSGTGGVVLMSSPVPDNNEKYFLLNTAAGNYGMFSVNGSYNVSANGNSSLLSYSHQKSDGYRMHTNMRRDVANYHGKFRITGKQDLSITLLYSDLFYQTPGGLNAAELAANPKQARPAAGAFRSAAEQQAAIYLKTFYTGINNEFRLSSYWTNATGIYLSHTTLKNPAIRNYERKTEQGAGMRSLIRFDKNKFNAVFGGEYQYTFNNISVFGNRRGVIDTLQFNDEIDSRQFNIFLQAGVKAGRTHLTAGLSYNNYHYGLIRLSEAGSGKESSDFKPQLIPRVAISTEISKNISAYASVSKGYSPPSIDEVHASDGIFNKSILAETGINYEAGIKSSLIKNKLWVDITYYIFSLRNTIVSRRDSSGADFYVNAGKTKQKGLEIGVNYIPVNNNTGFVRMMKIHLNYTNVHAVFSEYQQGTIKFDGKKLTGTSPNVLVSGIDINTSAGIYGNFTYSYTDAIPLNDANTFFGRHYNMLYLRAGFRTKEKKKTSAELYIAYERSYNNPYSLGNDLNAAGNRFFNPSAPYNFSIGANFKLGLAK